MIDIRKIEHGYWWDAQGKFNSLMNNEDKLKELTVQMTDRCNLQCKKCNKRNFTFEDMKAVDIIRIIEEACDLGLKHIHLTGGEPTLHKDLPYVISLCKEKGLRIDMSSNGKFSCKIMKEISNAGIDSINISWDFIDEEPMCIKDQYVFDYGIDVFVNHMVMPSNYRELSDFLSFVEFYYTDHSKIIDIQLMPPRGDAQKFTKEQIIEFREIAKECYEISKKRFPMVEHKILNMLEYDEAEKGIYHDKITWPCHRSKSELRVGTKGFTTCTYLYRDGHTICGLDKSVKEAWSLCKEMCKNAPPIKEMCDLSCSPEVCDFNRIIETVKNLYE